MFLLVSVSESHGMLWHLDHDLIYIKINKMTAFFPTSLVHIAGLRGISVLPFLKICLSTTGTVVGSCGPVVTHRGPGRSAGSPSTEEPRGLRILRLVVGPCRVECSIFVTLPLCILQLPALHDLCTLL
jgi:hypothetical protein